MSNSGIKMFGRAVAVVILLQLARFTGFAQCDTSRWITTISSGGGPVVQTLDAQDVVVNGVLTAAPSASYPNPYYVNFNLKDTFCITSNFSVEIKLKNDPAEGGAVAGDTWINLVGSGVSAGCLLEGDPSSQQYTVIFVGSSGVSNIPQLVMNLSSWRTIRLDFINNVVNWSYDGSNFFSLPYTGNICNIKKLNVGFRQAGQVDYIKVFDAYNAIVYYEEFNDCNNLATAPDCLPPDVSATSLNSAYCQDDSIKLSGSSNVSLQYTWTGPAGFSSTAQNPVIPHASVGNTGWYKLTGYVNPCTPVNKDSVYVTVNPAKTTNLFPSICQGSTYFAAGSNQSNTGVYYDTLATSLGCDSVIITNLSVLSNSFTSISTAVCQGDSFFVGGSFQKLSGIYTDTLTNSVGCDSVITTTLSLIPPLYQNQNINICLGDSIFLAGAYRKTSGVYNDTLNAITSCDSIIITSLNVIAPVYTNLNVIICQGTGYLAGGALQTTPGTYNDTLNSTLGCDSIIITQLQVTPPLQYSRNISICQGDSFFVGGNFQSLAGIFVDTVQTAAGCDSIVTTTLQLIPPVFGNRSVAICQGDSLFVGGAFQTVAGSYIDTIQSVAGCDSVLTTNLQLIAPAFTNLSVNICQGDSFFVGGNFQKLAGIYADTLQSLAGCDSIVTTSLQIIAPVISNVSVSICNGSSYFASGVLQTTAGTYNDTLTAATGCDSIVITHLQVIFPVFENKSVSICDGQSYLAGGIQQTFSGTYVDTLQANTGCDSILITQLTVLPNPVVYLGQDTSICEGTTAQLDAGTGFSSYLWNDGSQADTYLAEDVGSYWVKVTDANGCSAFDTLLILQLLPNPGNFLPLDSAVCGKFLRMITIPGFASYSWSTGSTDSSVTITNPGDYTLQVKDANGCVGTDDILFDAVCDQAVLMPNAFTPNGDGLNDEFKPVLLDKISSYELKIFNRWGKLIFYSKDPDKGWDGRENNLAAAMEEYVWTVRYKNDAGQDQFEKGSVALLR